jgi:hypothetical protein
MTLFYGPSANLVSRLCVLALLAAAVWLHGTGCRKEELSCSTEGAFQCDFYVEALMTCAPNGEGQLEWTVARICPKGTFCTANDQDPAKACVNPFEDATDSDAKDTGDTTDADATDANDPGAGVSGR